MTEHGIEGIDLLVSNLYPFEATVAKGASFADTIEQIDIGGPAMTRSAAKNHAWVTVVVDPQDYAAVLGEMDANNGAVTGALRRKLAQIAFARTAAYDAAVSNWFADALAKDGDKEPPRRRSFAGALRQPLRYGEKSAPGRGVLTSPAIRAPASPPRRSSRAANCPTTTSTTPTRRTNSSPNSRRPRPPPAPSSSMPIPAASRSARAWPRPTRRRSPAIRSAPSAACSPSTVHSTAQRRRRSPSSSPK